LSFCPFSFGHCVVYYSIGGIKWTQNPVNALGIFFGHNKEECQKLNWEKKIEEMKNKFTAKEI
jgi:hypothetical protein